MNEFRYFLSKTAYQANEDHQKATLAHIYRAAMAESSYRHDAAVEGARESIERTLADMGERLKLENRRPSAISAWFDISEAETSFNRLMTGTSRGRRFSDDVLRWLLQGDFDDRITQSRCRKICGEKKIPEVLNHPLEAPWFDVVDQLWIEDACAVPLVGRDLDLREHLAYLTMAVRARRHYLLVGPTGVGKTAFVRRLLAEARGRWSRSQDPRLQQHEFVYVSKLIASEKEAYGRLEELDRYLQSRPHAVPVFDGFELFLAENLKLADVYLRFFGGFLQGGDRSFGLICTQDAAAQSSLIRHLEPHHLPPLEARDVRPIVKQRLEHSEVPLADPLDRLVDEMIRLAQDHYPGRVVLDVALRLVDGLVGVATAAMQLEGDELQLPAKPLGIEDLRRYVARQQGLSVEVIGLDPDEFYRNVAAETKLAVVGQNHVVDRVCDTLALRAGGPARRLPRCRCLFVGPPGVGKTELARTLAEKLGYGQQAFFRYNMSDFADEADRWRFIGAPVGYKGHDEVRTIFDEVRERPSCVILLDEIDRAHISIQDILLSMLEGQAKDGRNKTVYFAQAIFLMTTNLCQELVRTALRACLREQIEP